MSISTFMSIYYLPKYVYGNSERETHLERNICVYTSLQIYYTFSIIYNYYIFMHQIFMCLYFVYFIYTYIMFYIYNMQLIIIIHRLPICQFAYLLKYIRNISSHSAFTVIEDPCQVVRKWSCLKHMLHSEMHKRTLPPCFSFYTVCKCPFCGVFSAMFFILFVCFMLVILLLNTAPTCRAEVLSSVHKHVEVVMCLMEKIQVLDKLCSDLGCYWCGFNVNKSTIRDIQKREKKFVDLYVKPVCKVLR